MSAPRLTIGIAVFDDFDGLYFTITSLMIHHREVMSECRILVVDNHPQSKQGKVTRDWVRSRVPNGDYHPFPTPLGTSPVRNEIFRVATAPAVLCLDSHVLLPANAIRRLIEYYAAHPNCRDLLTGPLLNDAGEVIATHQRPQWSRGAWGVWDIDSRGKNPLGEPFPIWQQGMGLFSCRRDAWVGFHPQFRGFGGGESYIMEKVRRSGAEVLCCPWLRWTHRFPRPGGVPYPLRRNETLQNYLIGFRELGLDTQPVLDAYRKIPPKLTTTPAQRESATSALAVLGNLRFGGVRMRGTLLARHLNCKLIEPTKLAGMAHRQTIVAIKNDGDPNVLRARCDRLIYDPLDAFFAERSDTDPVAYWKNEYARLRFDDIIATSPACAATMREALPEHVQVHVVPHQCDSRPQPEWRDPEGPVVYSGLSAFLNDGRERIKAACRMIGKSFVMGTDCDVLKGASLALALRLPPYDTPLNRHCKPQIKVENAVAAGLPVVTTDCPATLSHFPGVTHVPVHFTATELAKAMQDALEKPVLKTPFRDADYLAAMDRLLSRQSLVIYTAIFGGHDELREPRKPFPGARYICFTDNPRLRSKVWQIQYRRPEGNPLMQAKRYKLLSHEVLNCAASIWIDGRIDLQKIQNVPGRLESDLALVRHPTRSCIYEEADHCRRIRRGDPAKIATAVTRYQAQGHPSGYGLWMGGIIVRRHTPSVAAFNQEWWREVSANTPRDQIALPVVLRRLGMAFDTLPSDWIAFHVNGRRR